MIFYFIFSALHFRTFFRATRAAEKDHKRGERDCDNDILLNYFFPKPFLFSNFISPVLIACLDLALIIFVVRVSHFRFLADFNKIRFS